jgi:hypothetical protein
MIQHARSAGTNTGMARRLDPDSLPSRHCDLSGSIPQVMAHVSAGMLLQIILVILFCRIKFRRFGDFRDDGVFPFAGFVDSRLDVFGDLPLFFAGVKDG